MIVVVAFIFPFSTFCPLLEAAEKIGSPSHIVLSSPANSYRPLSRFQKSERHTTTKKRTSHDGRNDTTTAARPGAFGSISYGSKHDGTVAYFMANDDDEDDDDDDDDDDCGTAI